MKYLYLLVLSLNGLFAFSQNLRVVFAQEWHIEELAPGLGTNITKKVNNCISIFQYNYSGNLSDYYFVENRKKDPNLPGKLTINETILYKDLNNNYIYKLTKPHPNKVMREKLRSEEQWDLSQRDTMSICGYVCHKALLGGNESTEFWFAPDIPVLDGPLEYYGLPGFILQVRHKGMSLTAITVEFPKNLPAIRLPIQEKYITSDEFKKLTNPE